jgi:hypothetical protein
VVDLLSGYQSFPAYAFSNYPFTLSIYKGFGLNSLPIPDKSRAIGVIAFGTAVLCFAVLRLQRGIGGAVGDAMLLFAAPILVVFELALWHFAPIEMYWHATALVPWSLGRYLTPQQFVNVVDSPLHFVWGGNLYLLSNWLVLAAASGLFVLGVATARHLRLPILSAEAEEHQ